MVADGKVPARAHRAHASEWSWRAPRRKQGMSKSDKDSWNEIEQEAVQYLLSSEQPPCRAQPSSDDPIHQRLLRRGFELCEDGTAHVGSGAYGCVVRARRLCDGRSCVVKRQPFSLTAISAETVLREISILNAARGATGIVQIEDAFMENMCGGSGDGAEVWAVLEHFPTNLLEVSHEFRAEWSARRVVFQLLRGLQSLHFADIIHRDLKPANVLVDMGANAPFSTRVVICDFGLSRSIGDTDHELHPIPNETPDSSPRRRRPKSTNVVSAPWRAPELWGWADVERMSIRDMKSLDIFSLGLLWAELLGGSRVILSEDDRDPPELRMLEILRLVDVPNVSILEELGFCEGASSFVRNLVSENLLALQDVFCGQDWPQDSLVNQGYMHHLLHEQSYTGIRKWVLSRAPSLCPSSPALALIENATRFDYRMRLSAEDLLSERCFAMLQADSAEVSTCRRLSDVGNLLEQEAARRCEDVDDLRLSVGRVAKIARAEIARAGSGDTKECPCQPKSGSRACASGASVLLGRFCATEMRKSRSQTFFASLRSSRSVTRMAS